MGSRSILPLKSSHCCVYLCSYIGRWRWGHIICIFIDITGFSSVLG
uniref:Uncharacterized protein n=1 Tax=Anguilla anguilla TaxID=7936 RepID=A0A0E9WGK3_ANGAN